VADVCSVLISKTICRRKLAEDGTCPTHGLLALGESEVKLHDTTDAQVWTDEFCKHFGLIDARGEMLGWFANAIEAGHTAGDADAAEQLMRRLLAARYIELHQLMTGVAVTMNDAMQRIDKGLGDDG
jgi:hypothetical protein